METVEELYGRFLMAAAITLCAATLFLKKRTELAWHAAGAVVAVLVLVSLL